MIRKVERNDIDQQKWNALIANQSIEFPYAYTWYLDAVAKNWQAIVYGDYEAVMPLPYFRKWGIKQIFQPPFCQQLGVFQQEPNIDIAIAIYRFLQQQCCFIHVHQNINLHHQLFESWRPKDNFQLDLKLGYETLQKEFNSNAKRNIQKAVKAECKFSSENIDAEKFVSFYQKNTKDAKVKIVSQLINEFEKRLLLFCPSIMNKEGNIIASCLFIKTKKRVFYLVPVNSEEGRENGAMHFLIAKVIEYFLDTEMVLDFEGSSVASIANFYRSFGAVSKPYFEYRKKIR